MVDFIKVRTTVFDFKYLVNNFDFYSEINEETGEVKTNNYGNSRRILFIDGLTLIIFENLKGRKTLMIKGSLHKYWNKGRHNFNDFGSKEIRSVIFEISRKFRINPKNIRLHNLEIGFNIVPPTYSKNILKGLISHRNKPFKNISKDNAEYWQCVHSCFYIKAYDKRLQYISRFPQINTEILRFEAKYTRMRDLNKLVKDKLIGDKLSLMDLNNSEVLKAIGLHTLKYWNEILFYDHSINGSRLPEQDYINILRWQNSNHWTQLNKNTRHLDRKKLSEITKNHSDQFQEKINILLHKKLDKVFT